MKKLLVCGLAIFTFIFSGCKLDEDLEDPNNPKLGDVDVDLLLTGIQINLDDFFSGISTDGMELTRMIAAAPRGSTYETYFQPQDFDEDWIDAYANILPDIERFIPIAEEIGYSTHVAVAKIVKAYVLVTLVDVFGDVPYTEAFQGADNLNPALDAGSAVYDIAYAALLEAKEDLAADEVTVPVNDLFYSSAAAGYEDTYTQLANTLLLKIDLQRRLVDASALTRIQALIDDGNLMTSNWTFDFSPTLLNPDSRHSFFGINYDNGAATYMSNSYMARMRGEKSVTDPRIRYYFYRQETTISSDPNDISCISESAPAHYGPGDTFCNAGNGYWGRDHIDTDGIPPDNLDRTTYGVYPVGGRYDNSDDASANNSSRSGAGGAGFHPYMMVHFKDFMLAEYYNAIGDAASARTALDNAVQGSLDHVRSFSLSTSEAARIQGRDSDANYASISGTYMTDVLNAYDAATDADGRLQIIMREYWYAAFGNGIEIYNGYRRTGKPDDMQPALNANAGLYMRSLPYPSNLINRNSNAESKGSVSTKVFWDNNPDNFIY